MYLLELIVKLFSKTKTQNEESFDPFAQDELSENCEHMFLPIDSSEEILACTKCGLVVKKSELKDINIFKN